MSWSRPYYWSDRDKWVIAVTVARPDGVLLRRYVRTLNGPDATFTKRQTEAMRFGIRREAERATCDVRLINRKWHPVRMVRLTRDLDEDR